jgi:hypothetical protein
LAIVSIGYRRRRRNSYVDLVTEQVAFPKSFRGNYAIGYKSNNHDEVERVVGEDLKYMASCRTLGLTRSLSEGKPMEAAFSAQMFLSLGEQPEQRGGNV